MKHKHVKRNEFYKNGALGEGKKCCDRCGEGTYMAAHKDRWYCGKCGMTVWKKAEVADKA